MKPSYGVELRRFRRMAQLPLHLINYIIFNYCTNMCMYCTTLANEVCARTTFGVDAIGLAPRTTLANEVCAKACSLKARRCSSNYCHIDCENVCCTDCAFYCNECDGFYCSEDCFNSNTSVCYWCAAPMLVEPTTTRSVEAYGEAVCDSQ